MARINGFLVAYIVGCAMMTGSTTAFLYSVGGESGWAVPDKTTFYQDWAKNKTFVVGDELIFMYSSGHNNVFRVNKKDYDNCNSNDPIEAYVRGPTALTLTAAGDYYYFSNIGLHCEYGMKVHVTVDKDSSGQKLPPRQLLEVASTSPSASTTTTTTTMTAAPAPGPAGGAPLAAGKQPGIVIGVVFSLGITFMLSLFI